MPVKQSNSLSNVATDPLRNFKFQVTLNPPTGSPKVLGFMTVSGLAMTIDVIPYRTGGMNTTTQKMPGQADFNPITMSTGVVVGTQEDLNWISQLFDVMQGSGTQNPGDDFRMKVDVAILDHPVTTASAPIKAAFRLYNAWPTSMAFSDLDAGANQLFIKQLSLAHEGYASNIASSSGSNEAANFSV